MSIEHIIRERGEPLILIWIDPKDDKVMVTRNKGCSVKHLVLGAWELTRLANQMVQEEELRKRFVT